jgi:type II secretory pathway pseudopilin PulG
MRASGGVTVLEAVATLALLAFLLAVALPNLLPSPELEARVTAREVAADASLARQLAVSRGTTYLLEFRPPGGPYRSYTVRADGGTEEPGFPKDLPANVQVTGPEVIPFLPSGAAALDSPQVEVTFTGGAAVATLRVLQATGYVRVDPP